MSVTFSIAGERAADDEDRYVNLNNANAADVLRWLGLPAADLYGEVPARELGALCRRRLWDEARNHDDGVRPYELTGAQGARAIFFGREPGYLRRRAADLLALAELAGEGTVRWG
jgi:hypothetical protein